MRKLIGFFERKAVELKPKMRYAWWAMVFAILAMLLIFFLFSRLQTQIEWLSYLLMPLAWVVLSVMIWAWGVILICSWFKPNRTKIFLFESFSACMLVVHFASPIWGALWLYVPSLFYK